MHFHKMPAYPVEEFVERAISEAAEAHQAILDILRSPNLTKTVLGLYDPESRRVATASPLDAARKAGIVFPDGSQLYFHEFVEGWEVEAHIPVSRGVVIVGYSSIRGLYTI